MQNFYFAIATTGKVDLEKDLIHDYIAIIIREWQVTMFDVATILSSHLSNMPLGLLDFYVNRCSFEIRVSAKSLENAIDKYEVYRMSLYCNGISPFFSPFISNYSVNEIAGINSRDSKLLIGDLPEKLKSGITTESAKVKVNQYELHFICHSLANSPPIDYGMLIRTIDDAKSWEKILKENSNISTALRALQSASFISPRSQAVLHLWSGIEALFPEVHQELVFRISMYIASMIGSDEKFETYKRIKKAYGVRSKITHGTSSKLSEGDWQDIWKLAIDIFTAIRINSGMPKEEELVRNLLK